MSIEILPLADLLSIPEPEWLITDHLHEQEIAVLYGKPGAGKSFVALDWAFSIATGIPWLKQFKTKQTPVLYLAGEGAASLQKRAEAWLSAHTCQEAPVYFQCRPLPLLEDETIEALQEALDAFPTEVDDGGLNPGFIVVDTLSQFMMGGEENGPDMALFVSHLRQIGQERNSTILIVHHTNKGGEQERGHTALRGNVDVMFRVAGKDTNGLLTGIELQNDKQRDNPRAETLSLVTRMCHKSLVISGLHKQFVTACDMSLTSESLIDMMIAAVTSEDTKQEVVTHEDWVLASGMERRTFYRNYHKLLKLKLVKPSGRGMSKFTPVGRETAFKYCDKRR